MKINREGNTAVFLLALAGAAALFGLACVTVSDAGAKVRMTSNSDDVKTCKLLGHFTAVSGWGDPAAGNSGRKNVEGILRNKTAELGGDTMLLTEERVEEGKTSGAGDAYLCAHPKP